MTERNLLIKFAVSDSSSNFSAIAADAPTSIRVFSTSSSATSDENNGNQQQQQQLLYTVSAIPQEELLLSSSAMGNFDSSVIGASHSTINESLTALNMSSGNNHEVDSNNNNEEDDAAAVAVENFTSGKSFSCDLVMGTSSGRVSLFDCVSGKLRWSRFVPDGSNVAVRAVACSGGFVFVATARHTISVFSAADGRVVFNGGKFSASSATAAASVSSTLSSGIGSIKSMSALTSATTDTVYAFAGGLQPVVYRMGGTTSASKVLEPFLACRVQSAPADRVKLFTTSVANNNSTQNTKNKKKNTSRTATTTGEQEQHQEVLLGATSIFSEGLIRIWNLSPNQQQDGKGAVCIQVFDISAVSATSAVTNLHQRFSFFDVGFSSSNGHELSVRAVASTVSGTLFLWNSSKNVLSSSSSSTSTTNPEDDAAAASGMNNTNQTAGISTKESISSIAPCSTILSPDAADARSIQQKQVRNNNRKLPSTSSSRIVAAYLLLSASSSHHQQQQQQRLELDDSIVVLRRNWSAPMYQSWSWNDLTSSSSSSSSANNEIKTGDSSQTQYKILPSLLGGGGRGDSSFQQRRLIHLPASAGKMTAHAALKGLDLPTAGVQAFPKVNLYRASEMGELPTYQQQQQEDGGAADGEDGDDTVDPSTLASIAKKKRAGVAPALYQALHAEDVSLIMEILNVADRSDYDRNATVESLTLPYIVQLLNLLSRRIIDDGTAKSPLHAWVSSVMQLRGNELFQVMNDAAIAAEHKINPANLKAALIPLLEQYRGILNSVGNLIAFSAGRSSIFKSVKRRAANVANRKKETHSALYDGPRYIDTAQGVIRRTGKSDRDYHLNKMLKKKLKKRLGADGQLVADEDDADVQFEDDDKQQDKFKEFDEEEDYENDEEQQQQDDDLDEVLGMDEEDIEGMLGEDDEEGEGGDDVDDGDDEGVGLEDLHDELGSLGEMEEDEENDFQLDEEHDDEDDEELGEEEEEEEDGDENEDDNGQAGDDDDDDDDSDDSDDELEEDGVVEHMRQARKGPKLDSHVQYD